MHQRALEFLNEEIRGSTVFTPPGVLRFELPFRLIK